jgi:hypothetical protein
VPPHVGRRFALVWRIVLATLAGTLAVVAAGVQFRVFHHVSSQQQFALAAGVAIMTLVDNCRGAVARYRAPAREHARSRVQKAVVAALVRISTDRLVDIRFLGASVFVLRRQGWLMRQRLVPVVRFRLDDSPQPSAITWSRGKGVIGRCWLNRRTQHVSCRPVVMTWGKRQLTSEQFEQLPEVVRSGFSYREFVGIAHKYAEILAVPILSEAGETLGVMSIDVAAKADLAREILVGQEVEDVVSNACALVRDDLSALYGQT